MIDDLMNVVTRLFLELLSFKFLIKISSSTQAMKWKFGLHAFNKYKE